LTQPITPSETTPESIGSPDPSINIDNSEDSPPLEKPTEVSESRVILMPRLDPPEELTTREETSLESRDIDVNTYLNVY
jgi:hypothetical protein